MRTLRRLGCWAGMMIVLASFGAWPAAASHQNDGPGLGLDAPDQPGTAANVAGPVITGVLDTDEGDFADWYRVASAPNMGLKLVLQSPQGGVNLQVTDDYRNWFWNPCCQQGGPGTYLETYVSTPTPAYRLGVSVGFVGGPYTLTLTPVALCDLRIDSVVVTPQTIATDLGPLPTGTQRTIDVTATNLGPGTCYWAGMGVWIRHDVGRDRDVGGNGFGDVPPGATRTTTVNWDGTGEVGDVTVSACVGSPLDSDGANNCKDERSYVLAGNLGAGVDLLNNGASVCDPFQCMHRVDFALHYDSWGKGADADAQAPASANHVGAHSHPGRTHAFVNSWGPYSFGNGEAGLSNGGPFAWLCAPPAPR